MVKATTEVDVKVNVDVKEMLKKMDGMAGGLLELMKQLKTMTEAFHSTAEALHGFIAEMAEFEEKMEGEDKCDD